MQFAANGEWIAMLCLKNAFLGLCYAIAKHKPETVEVPYERKRKENKQSKAWI